MTHQKKIGVLLANLGTPKSPAPRDVFHYLNEFLTDARVITYSWLARQFLVRGLIVPTRYRQSAKLYQRLWTKEGSPLLIHGKAVKEKLQIALGPHYKVVLGMRYQMPSLEESLQELKHDSLDEIIVFPLFPQYASATTGSVHEKVMEHLKSWTVIPRVRLINNFANHPTFIHALCERGKQYPIETYDHIIFSFHGLPERQIKMGNPKGGCLTNACCQKLGPNNKHCYKAQCFATARAVAKTLDLKAENYTVCFQSRLGKEPWIQPYTSEVIAQRAAKGDKKILVFSPSFVCDCLETTIEISHEYHQEFQALGGEVLQLVEGLNDHSSWIESLRQMILEG